MIDVLSQVTVFTDKFHSSCASEGGEARDSLLPCSGIKLDNVQSKLLAVLVCCV
jgi:hypothetical protein